MSIPEILATPRIINNIHESSFRTYHILEYVLKMVERGDSKKTILQTAQFLKYFGNQEISNKLTKEEMETLKGEYEKFANIPKY